MDLYHLPKLAETALVDYDESTGILTYRRSVRLERVLSVVREDAPGR